MEKTAAGGRFLRGEKWEKLHVEDTEADFYVSPEGNDTWSGTLAAPSAAGDDGPFATIERARQAVQLLKAEVYSAKKPPAESRFIGCPHPYGKGRDILVLIRAGHYALEEPVRFGPDDGGERIETGVPTGAFEFHKLRDHFVTYAAYPGEKPVIAGGRRIGPWQHEGDRWVARLEGSQIARLVANGRTQPLARTPNEGYFTPAEMPESTEEFAFHPGDLEPWPDMAGNRIVMLLRWHTGINSIAEVDTDRQVVRLAEPQPGIVVVPPRYYVENVEALLDAPGEWFHDAEQGRLSYIPEEGMGDPNDADVVAPALSQLLVVAGEAERPVRNLRFYGLTLEATHPGDSAIALDHAWSCEVVDGTMRGLGNAAVEVGKGCYQVRVMHNDVHGTEGGGIRLHGEAHPDWSDLIHGCVISHNRVSDCASTSIHVSNARDTIISHNEITRTRGRTPLQVGGWSNVEVAIEGGYRVEYNHIHHVQEGSDDSGAITTAGLTTDSIIRGNLIHDVAPGYFNENVAMWYDNMSSGWTVEDNVYYNLKQAEMKLCACLLEDNVYRDNFLIEAPDREPEGLLEGEPDLRASDLRVSRPGGGGAAKAATGETLEVSATVTNAGVTGVGRVDLYVDGKVAERKKFAAVANSPRRITFEVVFHEPGEHDMAIGATPCERVVVEGSALQTLHQDLTVSAPVVPAGEEVAAQAVVRNVTDGQVSEVIELRVDGQVEASSALSLNPGATRRVEFCTRPDPGTHNVAVGRAGSAVVEAYPYRVLDLSEGEFHTHVSATARPGEFSVDPAGNRYAITAGGTDFLHAEDSYAAIFLKGAVTGNFVATVEVVGYADPVNPWYRAGLFVRNEMALSHGTEPGSLGSVLMYSTPKLAALQYDEYGDGCMHKGGNWTVYTEEEPFPVWLKLERRGDIFCGSVSRDGVHWGDARQTTPIPGLAPSMDIGMAAGTIDQIPARVELADFTLMVEDRG